MRDRWEWLVLALLVALLLWAGVVRWRVVAACRPAVELCPNP